MDKKKNLEKMQQGFLNKSSESVRDKIKKVIPFGGNTAPAQPKPNEQYDNKKQRPYGKGY